MTSSSISSPGSLSWETCFTKFNALSQQTRLAIRRAAAETLRSDGATEIGSSDVNHAIFAAFRRNGGDFEMVINEMVAEILLPAFLAS